MKTVGKIGIKVITNTYAHSIQKRPPRYTEKVHILRGSFPTGSCLRVLLQQQKPSSESRVQYNSARPAIHNAVAAAACSGFRLLSCRFLCMHKKCMCIRFCALLQTRGICNCSFLSKLVNVFTASTANNTNKTRVKCAPFYGLQCQQSEVVFLA